MWEGHIFLKIFIIIILASFLGFGLYYDLPTKVQEYYLNSLNDDQVTMDLDECVQLKLKKKEDYKVSSDNKKVAKIDQDLKISPVKAGETDVHVKTKRQDMVCHIIVANHYLNAPVIYLEPHQGYRLKQAGKSMYTSDNGAIEVNNGVVTCTRAANGTITTRTKNKTYTNKIVCRDVMSLMHSSSVTVYDATSKKFLYTKNSDVKMNPASITKILSVYTYLQKIHNVNAPTTLTAEDITTASAGGAVTTKINPSERVTYNDLLHGALLVSGADAIVSLCRTTYGSVGNLAANMNANAAKFGMTNSHFTNGIGMTDPNHYTTGKDLVKLMSHVLQSKAFKKVFYTKKYKTSNGLHVFRSPSSSYGKKVLGAKNGLTNAAQECVALEEKVNGHDLYVITMHAATSHERKMDIVTMNQYLSFKL